MLQATKQAGQLLPVRRVTMVVQPLHPAGSHCIYHNEYRLPWQLHISPCQRMQLSVMLRTVTLQDAHHMASQHRPTCDAYRQPAVAVHLQQ